MRRLLLRPPQSPGPEPARRGRASPGALQPLSANPGASSVFIKYNSTSGDAYLSEYGGDARGVLFTPQLPDGLFRQFGYLPERLFGEPPRPR